MPASAECTATRAQFREQKHRRNPRAAGLLKIILQQTHPGTGAGRRRIEALSAAFLPGIAAGLRYPEFRRFSEVFGTVSDSKFTRVIVTEGDEIMLNSAAGGGYGSPLERAREFIDDDLRQGFVSPEAAARDYRYLADE